MTNALAVIVDQLRKVFLPIVGDHADAAAGSAFTFIVDKSLASLSQDLSEQISVIDGRNVMLDGAIRCNTCRDPRG